MVEIPQSLIALDETVEKTFLKLYKKLIVRSEVTAF